MENMGWLKTSGMVYMYINKILSHMIMISDVMFICASNFCINMLYNTIYPYISEQADVFV